MKLLAQLSFYLFSKKNRLIPLQAILLLLSGFTQLAAQEDCSCATKIGSSSSITTLSTSLIPNPLTSYGCREISGILIVDQDFTIEGGNLTMMPGSIIYVDKGVTLTLKDINTNGGIHGNCDEMWQGIFLLSGGSLDMENCNIKDAQYAVHVETNNVRLR